MRIEAISRMHVDRLAGLCVNNQLPPFVILVRLQ